MSGRFLVFGDIHGEWDKFLSLEDQVQADIETDEIVFLGDYIDRGPDSKSVLDLLMKLPKRENIHLLKGNHEAMMCNAFFEREFQHLHPMELRLWMQNGGDMTYDQIAPDTQTFQRYVMFCQKMPRVYSTEIDGRLYRFIHAGFWYGASWNLAVPDDFLWDRSIANAVRDGRPVRYQDDNGPLDMTVVVGHTPTPYIRKKCYEPIVTKEAIFMDTGSYMKDGRISCMDLRSGQIWQSE